MNSFNFSLEPFNFWRAVLPDRVFFVGSFFFQCFEYHPAAFWTIRFLLKIPSQPYGGSIVCKNSLFSLLSNSLLVFEFLQFYYNVSCYGFLWAHEVLWSFSIWISISFFQLGSSLTIISLKVLPDPFLLYSSPGTLIMHILVPLMVPHKSLKSLSFSYFVCC